MRVALPTSSQCRDANLAFPADHYSHPDFKTEWWYYTGHLESESGKRYGYQVTFFRFGLRDRQGEIKDKPPYFTDLYMAHFAVSDIDRKKFLFRERINRGYEGKAGAATDRYLVWNEDWKVEGDLKNHLIQVDDRGTKLSASSQFAQGAGSSWTEWSQSKRRGRRTRLLLLFADANENRRRAYD